MTMFVLHIVAYNVVFITFDIPTVVIAIALSYLYMYLSMFN